MEAHSAFIITVTSTVSLASLVHTLSPNLDLGIWHSLQTLNVLILFPKYIC